MKQFISIVAAFAAVAFPAFGRLGDSSTGGADGYKFEPQLDCLAEVTQSPDADLRIVRVVFGHATRAGGRIDMGTLARLASTEGALDYVLETEMKPGEFPNSTMKQYPAYRPKNDNVVAVSGSGNGAMEFDGGESKVSLTDCRRIDPAKDKLVPLKTPGRVLFGFDGAAAKIDPNQVKQALTDLGVRIKGGTPYEVVVNKYYRMTAMFLTEVGEEEKTCAPVVQHPYLKQFHVDCSRQNMYFPSLERP